MESWFHLLDALGGAVPRLRLRPGVDESKLELAERALGIQLPADYRAWLKLADGQEPGGLAIFPACVWFMSIERVVSWCQHERTLGDAQAKDRPPCLWPRGHDPEQRMYCRMPPADRLVIAMHGDEPGGAMHMTNGSPSQVLLRGIAITT